MHSSNAQREPEIGAMYEVMDRRTAGWAMLVAIVALAASMLLAAQSITLSVPIETTNTDMILVPVKINGQDYVMLLDTGAQNSIIGEAGVGKARAQDSNRGLVFEAKAIRVTVQFKGGPIFKEHILSANLSGFNQRMGNASRCDGILGQDVLRKFSSVTIDYDRKHLELTLRTKADTHPVEIQLGPREFQH